MPYGLPDRGEESRNHYEVVGKSNESSSQKMTYAEKQAFHVGADSVFFD